MECLGVGAGNPSSGTLPDQDRSEWRSGALGVQRRAGSRGSQAGERERRGGSGGFWEETVYAAGHTVTVRPQTMTSLSYITEAK